MNAKKASILAFDPKAEECQVSLEPFVDTLELPVFLLALLLFHSELCLKRLQLLVTLVDGEVDSLFELLLALVDSLLDGLSLGLFDAVLGPSLEFGGLIIDRPCKFSFPSRTPHAELRW